MAKFYFERCETVEEKALFTWIGDKFVINLSHQEALTHTEIVFVGEEFERLKAAVNDEVAKNFLTVHEVKLKSGTQDAVNPTQEATK